MCGICGIIDYNSQGKISDEVLRRMCSRLKHRGPDDEGVYLNGPATPSVGLGHRRLSIIDLSDTGHQPMSNEDGTIQVVLNGEIYNYKELRIGLEERGHRFKSNTDTETILHLYEDYGVDCAKHLDGMFAFAVWDQRAKMLLLARDRFGKKPLLYYYQSGRFCFASEFLALLASGFVEKEINYQTIPYYLSFGYIPAPLTIYCNVLKLPPAHILILKDKEITIEQYWRLDYARKINISRNDAAEEVLRLLKEAVRKRLYSDVPLGAFLSGGIDSSTIVGIMSQLSEKKVKTFSIGFEEEGYNELKYARNIAKRFDTEHNEFIVRPNALEVLPLLLERYGEPFADSSCIPTYYVAQQARKYVTVALNGDGGDEIFAGYERYRAIYISRWYTKIPLFLRHGFIEPIINRIPYRPYSKNKINRLKRFLKGVTLPVLDRYLRWIAICDNEFQNGLYSDEFIKSISEDKPKGILLSFFNKSEDLELLDRFLYIDTNTYLPNDLLVKMDIATMANSLEARSPFLDHRLAELVASLKVDFKMSWLIKKYLLKNIIKDFVPRANINRPKMGFGVPIGKWFRGELKSLLIETLLSQKSLNRGYFNTDFIKDIIKQHLRQKIDYSQQLWSLLMLELWHRRFID